MSPSVKIFARRITNLAPLHFCNSPRGDERRQTPTIVTRSCASTGPSVNGRNECIACTERSLISRASEVAIRADPTTGDRAPVSPTRIRARVSAAAQVAKQATRELVKGPNGVEQHGLIWGVRVHDFWAKGDHVAARESLR